jgi:glutathione S-transferase
MALQVIGVGFAAMSVRNKYKVPYPDMGNGRHAQKLTDDQWEEFGNAQRTHYNYVEGIASVITFQLLGGLFYPKLNATLGALYIAGRALYTYGYKTKGPKGRLPGVLVLELALLAQVGVTIYGAVRLLGFV